MRYIIDTHVIIWFYESNPKLSSKALAMLLDPMNTFLVSPASFWEIAIKLSTGVSLFTEPFLDFIQHSIFDNGFEVLPIQPPHCDPLISLPYHHKDPFDRIIITQAMIEQVPILGTDTKFDLYPIQRIW